MLLLILSPSDLITFFVGNMTIRVVCIITIINMAIFSGCFSCGLTMPRVLIDIGIEKEVKEEEKIAGVHDERVEDVVVADVTVELWRV